MNIFKNAKPILTKLIENGFEAYFVGGCVRDKLLNKEIGDIDIATSALPEEVMSIFSKTVPTGLQHGTVLVIEQNESYEITTFRTESTYEDYRRPSEVIYVKSILEDLKRRDFTMNAIAMDVDENYIDPFKGEEAINQKLIQAVGNADERFHEDALRMMRGIRFVSQLDFTMHNDTFLAIQANCSLIEKIATERISVEFEKMLIGKSPKKAIQLCIDTNLIEHLPNFQDGKRIFSKIQTLPIKNLKTIEEFWALILLIGKFDQPESILRNWKMSNERMKQIMKLYLLLKNEELEWSHSNLYNTGLEYAIKYERLQSVLGNIANRRTEQSLTEQFKQLPIHSKAELCFTGNDLLKWTNEKAGPWLKEVISEIEKLIVEQKLTNNQPAIKEWFQTWHQK
ncbi:CCA tRNA nucleotidyltransferase [Gottfriedia solisilvae]|uniref:CCA-adding enzyme n=1 Tax=Gottfriedia solisilvae TaxID=1516104 RepID=A0A8J3AJU6_9BACI|nr:CCA tRNA nucleotidyltransferase [Gottfriedia solisilvae]GGI12287.1 CCA-adding enzyme [Gottfriedia solisilvae]